MASGLISPSGLAGHRGQLCNGVLNMKALVGTFNQEKVLVGAFSVIVKTDGSFAALPSMQHFFSGNVEIPLNFTFATDL